MRVFAGLVLIVASAAVLRPGEAWKLPLSAATSRADLLRGVVGGALAGCALAVPATAPSRAQAADAGRDAALGEIGALEAALRSDKGSSSGASAAAPAAGGSARGQEPRAPVAETSDLAKRLDQLSKTVDIGPRSHSNMSPGT